MIAGMAVLVAGLMQLFGSGAAPLAETAAPAPAKNDVLAMVAAWDGEIRYGAAYLALDPSRADQGSVAAAGFDPSDEYWGLPRAAGYEDVAARCGACHSIALVMQQRQNAAGWASVLDRMVERQGMPEPDASARKRIIDYLAAEFGRQ
ncbi:MAG TPA: hypothetical protein DDZ68_05790 [Parvularcula sp.]|nr:hypothetical protein [Parvularcula sp.]HBS31086.1 hypothetical protein [Parvularcula sp.]HBS33828.1 hypothetical protein [Parvularcula sp.]